MYMDPDYRAQVAMLICIPGIGEKAAVALLEQFGSVKGVCNASRGALLTVSGIGKQRAGTVGEFLAGEVSTASRKTIQRAG
jgi:ERCC4-type nuclease